MVEVGQNTRPSDRTLISREPKTKYHHDLITLYDRPLPFLSPLNSTPQQRGPKETSQLLTTDGGNWVTVSRTINSDRRVETGRRTSGPLTCQEISKRGGTGVCIIIRKTICEKFNGIKLHQKQRTDLRLIMMSILIEKGGVKYSSIP